MNNVKRRNLSKTMVIIGLLFLISMDAKAQININTNPYWQGEIRLFDGTIKPGYVMVPNNSKENEIAFRPSPKGEKETIKRKHIESVGVVSEKGKRYLYENTPIVFSFKSKKAAGNSLLLVEAKNDYVTFYVESQAYKVDAKSGEIVLLYRYNSGQDFPTITHYIKKKDAPVANMFYMTGLVGGIKKGAKYHLTEDPELMRKINEKELGKNDISEIINNYIQTTNSL